MSEVNILLKMLEKKEKEIEELNSRVKKLEEELEDAVKKKETSELHSMLEKAGGRSIDAGDLVILDYHKKPPEKRNRPVEERREVIKELVKRIGEEDEK